MSCTLGKAWLWLSPVGLWIIFSCPRPSSPVQVPKGAFILTGGSRGEERPWGLHSKPMTFKPSYRDTRIPAAFYHIHWLLTHLRLKRLKGRLVLLNKDFSGDLKEPWRFTAADNDSDPLSSQPRWRRCQDKVQWNEKLCQLGHLCHTERQDELLRPCLQ